MSELMLEVDVPLGWLSVPTSPDGEVYESWAKRLRGELLDEGSSANLARFESELHRVRCLRDLAPSARWFALLRKTKDDIRVVAAMSLSFSRNAAGSVPCGDAWDEDWAWHELDDQRLARKRWTVDVEGRRIRFGHELYEVRQVDGPAGVHRVYATQQSVDRAITWRTEASSSDATAVPFLVTSAGNLIQSIVIKGRALW